MPSALCGFDDGPAGLGRDLLVHGGPTIFVDIGFDPTFQAGTAHQFDLALKGLRALVDTGATECCVDSGVAMSLQLPIIDQRVISGVGGHHTVNMHLAQIFVPALNFTMHGAFAGVDLAAGGQTHSALLGRTFLTHFRMVYEGHSGTVSIEGPLTPPTPASSAAL